MLIKDPNFFELTKGLYDKKTNLLMLTEEHSILHTYKNRKCENFILDVQQQCGHTFLRNQYIVFVASTRLGAIMPVTKENLPILDSN